jgi:hypothetical protein
MPRTLQVYDITRLRKLLNNLDAKRFKLTACDIFSTEIMNELQQNYEITSKDLTKDKALKYSAWLSPFVLSILPALIVFLIGFFSVNPVVIFLSFFLLIGGFVLGLIVSGGSMIYRSKWLASVRERLAIDGIKASELTWFMHEVSSADKKSLRELEAVNPLTADAYRETLAAKLTATRIIKSSKQELLLVNRRQNKIKLLKSENSSILLDELKSDHENLKKINTEATEMKVEAETRLQMIEAASRRGTNFVDTELALKKLSARTQELPLALESLKMEEEFRKELENGD